MNSPKRIIWILSVLLITALVFFDASGSDAWARPRMKVQVKTILASNGPKHVDPRLSANIRGLRSVFRYSSYKLLGNNRMTLGLGQTGKAVLPGRRTLHITPLDVKNNRARMRLTIFQKKRQTFQTVIQLRNRGTITVGGPKHQNGFLLFNISNSF
ncbi:hypothetical protein QUF76_00065 [Desulfobacterales bacterium HSG16]|nr:hypothetical protein [Desulfobacterales bacterium HSG16]